MTSRLDELFSPDRLRSYWQAPASPLQASQQIACNAAIHAQYRYLQQLITETFADSARLANRFAELSEQFQQIFPVEGGAGPVESKQKDMLVEMLEQLEELLWAMNLPKGTSG